ncbi:hypothetical protein EVA_20823 [gut metagenome]|uniref:Uncharacterized protein n=1 Tax=gut metagenome TaxID=749906 RepID=J9F9G8_9ZZZZ
MDEEEEKKRKDLIQNLESIVEYEKKRLAKAHQLKMAEEEDKLQMKLFED